MPIISVDLLAGRTVAQKRAFVKAVTQVAMQHLDCPPETVKIFFHDLQTHDLADGGVLRCDAQQVVQEVEE